MPSRMRMPSRMSGACGALGLQDELKKDVVTYGLMGHPLDPGRETHASQLL